MIEITCIECGEKLNKFQGDMDERTCMTCILKEEDPDAIASPSPAMKAEIKRLRTKKPKSMITCIGYRGEE